MTTLHRVRSMLAGRIVILLFSSLLASAAFAERWHILWYGTFDAVGAVELDSITPAPGYPTAIALWVYVHRGLDTFSCAPPSDCIATSQLTYYYVDCRTMHAAEIRRIPMNLRGKVVEIIDSPSPAWFWLEWAHIERESDREGTRQRKRDMAWRHRELRAFCGYYNTGAVR